MQISTVCFTAFVVVLALLTGCEGKHSVNQAERVASPAGDVRATVETYVKSALAGDEAAITAVCVPGKAVARQAMTDLLEIPEVDQLHIIEIRAGEGGALAVSNLLEGDHDRVGHLVFRLELISGKWLIDDIDFEDDAGLASEVDRFMRRYTDATVLMSSG